MHADDIRTLASGHDSLERQIDLVKCFAREAKSEILSFGRSANRARPYSYMLLILQLTGLQYPMRI